jgi:uncharacterized protein
MLSRQEVLKQRAKEHTASVVQNADGSLDFKEESIITPKGLKKTNKLLTIVPADSEKIVSTKDVPYLFQELKQMNIILTNACNLSCSYCYEQHNKDFGRFTSESLISAYRFLNTSNKRQKKVFNFFGGEPLIHKSIILQFLKENRAELEKNCRGDSNTVVGMVTNGLLLTEDLIDEFLSYDFTYFLISLDTDRAEVDHRGITQQKIDKLMDMISYMPDAPKQQKRVTIRCTLARENAPYFVDFMDHLYERGIRRAVVHPLVLDSSRGFISWDEKEWDKLHKDILHVLEKYEDFQIHFSEGVGKKGEENCMIGADMIAIDGSGDFSGCYFFTNQKAAAGNPAILGNIFNDRIYIDRYKHFQKEYAKMFEEEEQCKTCDYKNACYQCPAGNLDTGTKMFRPDDMCQKIVKLFVDLQEDIAKKQFKMKYERICSAFEAQGEEASMAKGLAYLFFYFHFNYHPIQEIAHKNVELIDDYRKLLSVWKKVIHKDLEYDFTEDNFISEVSSLFTEDTVEIDDFYYYVIDKGNLAPSTRKTKAENQYQRAFFLSLLHMIMLQNPHTTYEDTFSERLVDDQKHSARP